MEEEEEEREGMKVRPTPLSWWGGAEEVGRLLR